MHSYIHGESLRLVLVHCRSLLSGLLVDSGRILVGPHHIGPAFLHIDIVLKKLIFLVLTH